ncbi:MAG: hypothetical protein ACE5FF_10160, partial [Saprospiraceae bacterium]
MDKCSWQPIGKPSLICTSQKEKYSRNIIFGLCRQARNNQQRQQGKEKGAGKDFHKRIIRNIAWQQIMGNSQSVQMLNTAAFTRWCTSSCMYTRHEVVWGNPSSLCQYV